MGTDFPGRALTRRRMLRQLAGAAVAVGTVGASWLVANGTGADPVACIRPPGALDEDDFLATCIRCGRCADACPNRSIVAFTAESGAALSLSPGRGQHGTPVIFPRRQACMLCNGVPGEYLRCTEACPSGALKLTRSDVAAVGEEVHMGTAEVDTSLCYSFQRRVVWRLYSGLPPGR